ncbi:thiamine-phosphate kinase [Pseudomonas sp. NW5]|uniref:thiamine-phosphate kinase n=1 Tax=Pseudomonas sp. NW5 TaxID=2934934 RepID=UPI00201FCD3F|nr:thiamine-phosphate kinase [Pseudomonas sp. NW5]MCL7462824.1 thiamine-phosphate kinase [Pseudomonas sp. NW5]
MAAPGEFELIRRYFAAARCAARRDGVALGIGDDCALLQLPASEQLAISTDSLVAGVHFPHDPDPALLAQRALGTAASDLAAMGAAPLAFTLALTLPDAEPDWLAAFAAGLEQMAAACQLSLIGGDTTRGPLNLNITVFGRVPAGQALTRSGAQVGDLLCIGGPTGEAAAALPLVLGERTAAGAHDARLLERYWHPQPQLALGLALRGRASAALDVSDGLLADCGHIAASSGVRLLIEAARVPLSAALRAAAGEQALSCALSGGDDYVLAFTLPAQALAALQAAAPYFHVIGRVTAGQGVVLLDAEGHEITPARAGYQHFGGPDGQA